MSGFTDYYDVLGVKPRCHHRLIEEAYWVRARDLQSIPTRESVQALALLNEAYEVLGSAHKRLAYDRQRAGALKSDGAAGSRRGLFAALFGVFGKREHAA